jgi:uncharacterized protein (UPF0333 family)
MMEEKAQVNLEFLLIIVGAVVVVSIVAIYMKSAANTAANAVTSASETNP